MLSGLADNLLIKLLGAPVRFMDKFLEDSPFRNSEMSRVDDQFIVEFAQQCLYYFEADGKVSSRCQTSSFTVADIVATYDMRRRRW